MQEKIFDIIADYTGCEKSKITLESHMIDNLGADSLSAVEIVMEIEKQFDITIDDKQIESIVRVKDIIAIVESK
jgi:acyl carrier protein|tara:strand:+ start:599 stop:820 length:222 start_codon:yes stop_codon:yes gene_type:complete